MRASSFLEHAKENTLNFLIPSRAFDARKRALKKAYQWWLEEEDAMDRTRSRSVASGIVSPLGFLAQRERKTVHFTVRIYFRPCLARHVLTSRFNFSLITRALP